MSTVVAEATWSTEQSFTIPQSLVDQSLVVEHGNYDSLARVVQDLNSKQLARSVGYCICHSFIGEDFIVLWRSDKENDAHARFRASSVGPAFGRAQTLFDSVATTHDAWNVSHAFILATVNVDKKRVLDREQVDSVDKAVEMLNRGDVVCEGGFCIVYDASLRKHFVLFKPSHERQARRFFRMYGYSVGSRLFAARTVVAEKSIVLNSMILMFRSCEFCANVLLFAFAIVVIKWFVFAIAFALLWYLPAAIRQESLLKPLQYPLLMFVADDVSFLKIHPTPRNATKLYLVAVFRVCLLLMSVPMLMPDWLSPIVVQLPSEFQDILEWIRRPLESSAYQPPPHSLLGWLPTACLAPFVFVFVSSVVWLCCVICILTVSLSTGQPSPVSGIKNETMLQRIDELAGELESALTLQPDDCFAHLMSLKERRTKFKCSNIFNTIGPAFASLLHLVTNVVNAVEFILPPSHEYVSAGLLILLTGLSIFYVSKTAKRGVTSIFSETKESWDRGIWTPDYIALLRADRAVQAIPALLATSYWMSNHAKDAFKLSVNLCSFGMTYAVLVPFIVREYDYGCEQELTVEQSERIAEMSVGESADASGVSCRSDMSQMAHSPMLENQS
eukprot:TRINITY_DN35080_c0_g1_i1.p1 TRINITY_DN35080_c0_g1~~TRINITY_DN35080_c0_g1_i1.p1  ORF type:complete len:616 (-),score=51.74 TRINITY_DN35080_c0_g1_i1:26-1873(-)